MSFSPLCHVQTLKFMNFFLFIALTLLQSTHASQFLVAIDSCSGSGDTFSIDSVSVSCSSGYCSWGSNAVLSGKFTIGDSGVETQYPTLSARAWGLQIYNSDSNSTSDFNLCGNTTSTTGSSCPNSGTYKFGVATTLPNPRTFSVFSSSMKATVVTIFDFEDENVVCSFSVTSSSMWSSSSTSAAAFLVVGAALYMKKRRRVVTLGEHRNEVGVEHDAEEPGTHFEMMERIKEDGHLFTR